MSIHDLSDDGTIETLVAGDGFSLIREKNGPRVRADVWNGKTHRSVPFKLATNEIISSQAGFEMVARMAVEKLRGDVTLYPCLAEPVSRLEAAVHG